MNPFFTIGHSTRSVVEFVELLRSVKVTLVVDVRTAPRSRTNPQYNIDVLPNTLAPLQIGYEHIAELGGLRGIERNVPSSVNAFWQNRSFHNYADYALGSEFQNGLIRLSELGLRECCAIMCSEAVWWRCHRRIIADYLLVAGRSVFHIMGPAKVEPAKLTEGAQLSAIGLTYPAATRGEN
ncbi:DUF488 domain-containing protein [Pseudolabrys sp. Root1462]|uniref:DUF488 domain-containing protein n=1 Tax=Pseudolabrys sp. Root1462 TaxID=1736466 RepID=UPI0009E69CBF|nr:DUF488 domain-containing protein [Pseudolabrys sp. Root1462]